MTNLLEDALRTYSRAYITDIELAELIDSTANSRYSKVKRLIAQGKLIHLRRGLYCLSNQFNNLAVSHPFELAQFIYAPSYISLESALSYHNLIPEAVYTTTSVCAKRSKEFYTPLGIFSYLRLPLENFYTEVELISENNYKFFMAKPWKAICDYIFCYKKDWSNLEPVLKSLRIDYESLPLLRYEELQLLDEYYHHRQLSRFLRNLKKELKL